MSPATKLRHRDESDKRAQDYPGSFATQTKEQARPLQFPDKQPSESPGILARMRESFATFVAKLRERRSRLPLEAVFTATPPGIPRSEELTALRSENALLRIEQLRLTRSRDRYRDLYEFAPVSYLTLDGEARVIEINLTGARLLGLERNQILGRAFSRFIASAHLGSYDRLIRQMTGGGGRQTLDLTLQRADETIVHAQLDCVCVAVENLAPTVRITLVDITERKRAEAEIKQLAFYDPLTNLPNRRLLLDRVQHALLLCARTNDHGAILFIDLDDFKSLNDTQGHDLGDLLLKHVAQRISSCVRESDTVARLGGDEFVVMLQFLSKDLAEANKQASQIANKILEQIDQPYFLEGQDHRTTGSIGITLFSDSLDPVEGLLKRADLALYRAKTAGRSTMQFFNPEMQATVLARGILEVDLRRAIQDREFVLHYQPQVDFRGQLTGAEALLRWKHPVRGLLAPAEFISFAEEKGLIGLVGEWVLTAACTQLKAWSLLPAMAHLRLAINVSAHEFSHPDFVTRMLTVVDDLGADPRKLILEFTEHVMLGSMEDTLTKMTTLKARGIYFSLDDFGIGYSSLAYLKSLPMDQLKIDRTFVRDVLTNPNDASIARSIIALGQSLGLAVIAEGVETEEQLSFLAQHGCRAYQGYLFGRPAPVEDLYAFV